MASLHILRGFEGDNRFLLDDDEIVLGRDSECDVVIPGRPVSRRHARILRVETRFYLEDLGSRNLTYLNDREVTSQVQLKDHDRIRICDFVASFEEADGGSSVTSRLSHSSVRLETQPAEKLRILLEVSAHLSRTLEFDALLPRICDRLFGLFRQADRSLVILAEKGSEGPLVSRVVQTRHREDEGRYSRSIVRLCLRNCEALLSEDAQADQRYHADSVAATSIRSVMCAPLVGGTGKPFGVIQVDALDPRKKFNNDDLALLVGVANQAAVALENARYHTERIARERLVRDLEVATAVQRGFLPSELPVVPGYEFFAAYEPALAVGGDYYDFIPLPGGRLAVTVADVCGKGVSAALLMIKLASDARLLLPTLDSPAEVVRRLNDRLYPHAQPTDRFVTLTLAILDPDRHTLTLASAGHPAPLLYRAADQSLHESIPKAVRGTALGLWTGIDYESCELPFEPGDALIMYSDGVPDALSATEVRFGMTGLRAAIQATGTRAPRILGQRIHQAIRQHGAGQPAPFDDITLVCLGRL